MTSLFRALRSFIAVVCCLLLLGLAAPVSFYVVLVPWTALHPARGRELGARWVSTIARMLVSLMRAGGATFEIDGEIDCDQPGVVIMNHQSVLEIAPLILITKTRLPSFVARARYAKWIPTVSRAIDYLDCIIVDPARDRAAAILAVQRRAEKGLRRVVLLFPEGHRTLDGHVGPFRPGGMVALLKGRRLPVWIVVADGFWRFRKVIQTFFGLGSVRGRMRVVGQLMSPENPDELPAFIEECRQTMIRELATMRAEDVG